MKVDFKTNKQTVIAVNALLSRYDNIEFYSLNKRQKVPFAMRMELRYIFIKKTMSCNPAKDFKMKLPYYLADELLDVIREYCESGAYNNGIELLKNQLHPQLL
ncbi:hypothetical protein [Chryseobacterium sp. KCF3-3]|uniref:hypothetical protein n=1 Tax=Chryseobacterium sp. KCF3-3 TaxID=3231511 RepID=UPI0038B25C1E